MRARPRAGAAAPRACRATLRVSTKEFRLSYPSLPFGSIIFLN
jgi:hypothetical protein